MMSSDLNSAATQVFIGRLPANEGRFTEAYQCTREEADAHVQAMLDPPIDFACKNAAVIGLAISLGNLSSEMPGAEGLTSLIKPALQEAGEIDWVAAKAEAVAAFSKRRKYHFQYLSALHLGLQSNLASPQSQSLNFPLSQMVGAWAVRLELDGWRPNKHIQARVLFALANPNSPASRAWTPDQRQRAAGNCIHELRLAISKNRAAAEAMGLVSSGIVVEGVALGLEAFNSHFRRRMADLLEYKSVDGQAGAGGNGTLSAAGLKRAGRELLAAARSGRQREIHVAIEIVSHLTSAIVQLLPVQLKSSPPVGALAWLDVQSGAYCHSLFKLVEKGARPGKGTDSLYEPTTQVVRVLLCPILADALRRVAEHSTANSGEFCTVKELLGDATHGPHEAVAGQGPYRATASKLQSSIPTLLLQQGEFRWAVSVATSSPYVVSRGRPAYGVGRQTDIDRVVDQVHDLLAWPRPVHATDTTTLVGSFTTPKLHAVRLAFSTLANEADSCVVGTAILEDVIQYTNAHSAYISMLLALCYALRDRVIYKLPTEGLRAGVALKFNDKDVHEFSMPAVPTLRVVQEAMAAWETLLCGAVKALRQVATSDAMVLADRIDARLKDHESIGWVFTISVAHTLEPVGTRTWRDRLPRGLRLIGNFGRQFWPHRLADIHVSQLDADILLRHQMPALHPGSSHVCRPEEEIHTRLVEAMTEVVERQLDLPVPRAFRARHAG